MVQVGKESSFVHLHFHSSFSIEDGITEIEALLERAASLAMPALALTDHNNLSGAVRFLEGARKFGIKPILGCELDLKDGSHLILLAKNGTGYQNLCQLLTLTLTDPEETKGADREQLGSHSQGLIAVGGFRCGEISRMVRDYRNAEAAVALKFYREVYGSDFFLEVCRDVSGNERPLRRIVEFARQADVPLVATNAVHYLDAEDAPTAALRSAIANQISLERSLAKGGSARFLAPQKTMKHLFEDLPEALTSASEIADKCELPWLPTSSLLDASGGPSGAGSDDRLARLTYQAAAERCETMDRKVRLRIEEELAIIRHKGLAPMFLLVHQLVSNCREKGIRVQLRGSGVNSQVLYSLGVNNIEPLNHGLMFERFLHLNKKDMPDFDLDVQRSRREEVRGILCDISRGRAVTLGATNLYNARSLLRDAAPVLGLPKDAVFGVLEGIYGQGLREILSFGNDLNPELRDNRLLRHPKARRALEMCVGLDGRPHAISAHPSGMMVDPNDLMRLGPLQNDKNGEKITQYGAAELGGLGAIKVDLLSSPTLDVFEDVRNQVGEVSVDGNGWDDDEIFSAYQDGHTIGCFQIESALQRELAYRVRPETIRDMAVLLALGRPGPMRSRLHEEYIRRRSLPETECGGPVELRYTLAETHGILLFQEQTLEVLHQLAGFSYADADVLYRLSTRPDGAEEELSSYQQQFLAGAREKGMDDDGCVAVWQHLTRIGGYSFPKGHAVAYASLAYEALKLKNCYPAEYLCALLNNQPCGSYPARVLLLEAKRLGIGLASLDVNDSSIKWTVESGNLRVGLNQLRGMNDSSLRRILLARKDHFFTKLEDFVARTWLPGYLIENLVLAGAFDSLEKDRFCLLEELGLLLRKRRKGGRHTFCFPRIGDSMLEKSNTCSREKMIWEYGLLGFCSTASIYELLQSENRDLVPLGSLETIEPGDKICVAGSVVRRRTTQTRNGHPMRFFTIEDGTGLGYIVMFSDAQTQSHTSLKRATWLIVTGTVQARGPGGRSVLASQVEHL